MHGEIKLKRWLRYSAEQVICRGRGFIWRATVWMGIVPITGSDRLLNGEGAMRWNILGIVPVMAATGVDITRSAAGRTAAELVWLPSALLDEDVSWSATDPTHTRTAIAVEGESVDLNVAIEEGGRLKSLALSRWGTTAERSPTWISVASSRTKARLAVTRFRRGSGSDILPAHPASSRKASSLEFRSMTRSFDRRIRNWLCGLR